MDQTTRLLGIAVLSSVLSACGSGGDSTQPGSDTPPEIPIPVADIAINGAGVKGPLAGAEVKVYAVDYSVTQLTGSLLASGSTANNAAITGLTIPENTTGKLLIEFSVDADTIDITSNQTPSFSKLTTIVDATQLTSGEHVYASLLTSMATNLAILNADTGSPYAGNGDSNISDSELEVALDIAQAQIKSTLGFGLSKSVDIFKVPPLITSATDTADERRNVAAYRQANEALAAVVTKIADESSANDQPEEILQALVEDLCDGDIDGKNDNGEIASLSALDVPIATTVMMTDPSSLTIPGTEIKISEIESVLVEEKSITETTAETAALEDGTITVNPEMAATQSDIDQDGVEDSLDAFPSDPTETSDSDGDKVGDNADVFPTDPNEWTDTDGDQVGDNADVFPSDPTESIDSDDDGVGNNSDVFPNDPLETADTDGDGVGNNSDAFPEDSTRHELDSFTVGMWIGSEDTQVSLLENINGLNHYSSSDPACNFDNYSACANGQMSIASSTSTSHSSTHFYQDGYHHFVSGQSSAQLDVGTQRWVKRTHTAVLTFNDRMWVIAGNDGIHDGVDSESENPNDVSMENFDGFLAEDVWSSQDGNTWVRTAAKAEFGPRSYHSVAEFKGKMWLVGGSTYNKATQLTDFLNDIWTSVDGKNWTLVTSEAPFPARLNAALFEFDNRLWLVGGQGADYHGKSDVWYSENGIDWVLATENAGFRGQDYPNIVTLNNKLWLVGGSVMYSKVWSSSNGIDWQEETQTNYSQLTRNVSSVVVHDNKIWVVGGFDNNSYNNDVWVSEDGLTYRKIEFAEGHYFSDRVEPGLLSFKQRLWILGGRRSSAYGDILSSTDGASWSQHSFGPAELTQRIDHSFIGFKNKLFSFAGRSYVADSSIWSSPNGLAWQQEINDSPFLHRYGHETILFNNKLFIVSGLDRIDGSHPKVQSDVWSSNDGIEWQQETSNAVFEGRWGHKVVEWNGKLWMVAGFNNMLDGEMNDVWSSEDGINWTQETASASFPERYEHGLVVFNNKLWLIGGLNTSTFARYTDVWSTTNGVDWVKEADNLDAMFKPNDTGARFGFLTYVHNNKIFLLGGQDSAGQLNDLWSSNDGTNWTLENEDTGIKGRSGTRITSLNGELYLQGGGYQDGLAFFQKDVWKSSDGINWRVGFKAKVDLKSSE